MFIQQVTSNIKTITITIIPHCTSLIETLQNNKVNYQLQQKSNFNFHLYFYIIKKIQNRLNLSINDEKQLYLHYLADIFTSQ